MRIDHELHIKGSAAVARRDGAETAPEMFGFSERADTVRGNVLSNDRRHDETGIQRSRDRAVGVVVTVKVPLSAIVPPPK